MAASRSCEVTKEGTALFVFEFEMLFELFVFSERLPF
jgi:hypothetical protein